MHSQKIMVLLVLLLFCVHVNRAENVQFLTQIVMNTTAAETELKADLLNWIQSLHSITHFSSIYELSNISIFDYQP